MNPAYPLLLLLVAFPPGDPGVSTLDSVDRVRGGRHWIDQPTDPPRSPAESLKAFEIEEGLEIALFAAEPLVKDPVAIAFDEFGRAFVVEYGDYPTGPDDPNAKPLSRVVILDDTDGDHVADRRTVLADHLDFAHSLLPYGGGIIVGARTQLLFLKDTDGDDRADVREVLYEGFTPAHPQMQIGNPRYGLDNRVYCNYGPGTITSPKRPGEKVVMPRGEFVFEPKTWEFGPAAGLGQFGNTIDNWGRRFFCTNRNPIMTAPIPWEVARRNKYAPLSKLHYDVAPAGGDTRVHPLVSMKSNYLSHAGTHTSACGVTAYRGDLLGPEYVDDVFVCEPIGHLVTRSKIVEDGVELRAERIGGDRDFLASLDTWFRPASLADGPDGALYLADMYRLWVEHPKFLPDEVAERIDWRAGEDRGRIWRITRAGAEARPFDPPKTTADRVALLVDTNGWRRELGQRLIVEREDHEAAYALRGVLKSRKPPLEEVVLPTSPAGGRLRAMYALLGLGELVERDLKHGLQDLSPHVRRASARLLAERFAEDRRLPELFGNIARASTDEQLRFEVLLGLGELRHPSVPESVAIVARRDGENRWVRNAVLTACEERSGAVLRSLVSDEAWTASGDGAKIDLVRRLAAVVGVRGRLGELREVLELLDDRATTGGWWRAATLTGLSEGLSRHRGKLGRTSLAKLLADPPTTLAGSVAGARRVLEEAAAVAVDDKEPVGDRLAAIGLLGTGPFDGFAPLAVTLTKPSQPPEVRRRTLEAMRNRGVPAARVVLDAWPSLSPDLRGTALPMLLGRTDTARLTLEAMLEGRVEPSAVDLDLRVRLLRHRDDEVRKAAAELFGGAVSPNRREVAREYAAALSGEADVVRGRLVFTRVCAKCHRLDGAGHQVGPDLSDVSNRPRDALLHDVLDPNRKVEPRFQEYSVVTTDGRLFNGLLASETEEQIVLARPEGREETVPRADVELLKATGRSLMPEGVEKDVSVDEMRDLLEFLVNRRR